MAKVGRPKKNVGIIKESLTTTMNTDIKKQAQMMAFERGISVGELFEQLVLKEIKRESRRKKNTP